MNKIILSIIYWYCSTAKKFFSKMPLGSTKIVLISLVAQVATLFAALLPLKVVLLLGSTRIPRYFPEAFLEIDRNQLIIGLSIAAVCFFLLRMIAEKLIDIYTLKGSKFLLKKSRKIILYDNQSDVAKKAYSNFLRSMTGIIFFILAYSVVNRLYPALSLIVSGYIFLSCFLIIFFGQRSPFFRQKMEKKLIDILRVISLIGFFTAFAFIVADFILPIDPPGLIFALLGLILTRQMLNVVILSIKNISDLYNKRVKIDALFFQGYSKSNIVGKHEKMFWSLVDPSNRDEWIAKVLDETLGLKIKNIETTWHQTGINNIVTFEVKAYCGVENDLKLFFIKLFNNKLGHKAINDASLLQECDLSCVALDFLGATNVEQYHCHIFSWEEMSSTLPKKVSSWKLDLLKTLMDYEPPENFLVRYSGSHPLLWQRLNKTMIQRMRLVANDAQLEQLDIIQENFETIISLLSELPAQLVFSKLSEDAIAFTKKNNLKVISWGGWSFEPMGFGWPIENVGIKNLKTMSNEIKNRGHRSGLISDHAVVLSAVLSKFEDLFSKQDLVRALALLPLITWCIDHQETGLMYEFSRD